MRTNRNLILDFTQIKLYNRNVWQNTLFCCREGGRVRPDIESVPNRRRLAYIQNP